MIDARPMQQARLPTIQSAVCDWCAHAIWRKSLLLRFSRRFRWVGLACLAPGIIALFGRWNSIQRGFVGFLIDHWTGFGGRCMAAALLAHALRIRGKDGQRNDRRNDDGYLDQFGSAAHAPLALRCHRPVSACPRLQRSCSIGRRACELHARHPAPGDNEPRANSPACRASGHERRDVRRRSAACRTR